MIDFEIRARKSRNAALHGDRDRNGPRLSKIRRKRDVYARGDEVPNAGRRPREQ